MIKINRKSNNLHAHFSIMLEKHSQQAPHEWGNLDGSLIVARLLHHIFMTSSHSPLIEPWFFCRPSHFSVLLTIAYALPSCVRSMQRPSPFSSLPVCASQLAKFLELRWRDMA